MSRVLFLTGRIKAQVVRCTLVGWCSVCRKYRALLGVARWPGWEEEIVTGTCWGCGKTVSPSSVRPTEAA